MAAKRFVKLPAWTAYALSVNTALCAAVAPGAAWADAPQPRVFSIAPKAASEALIEFALQANLSIGGVNACGGASAGLRGRYTVDEGLTLLLAKTGCGFRHVAPGTVQIFAEPPRPAAPQTLKPVPVVQPAVPEIENEPVVVTATKRPALVSTLPYAVSALSHSQLEDAGTVDVDDVAVQIPGLSTTNLGLGRDKILLRGLSDGVFTGRTQSTVGIYLDDVPITYNAPDPDLQLADVESIEVLRGPQGELYGGGAMSGVYKIVTRKPALDAWSAYARIGGSLTDGGAASQEYEGMVNIPLVRDQLGFRAVAYETAEGGYIDATDLRQANVDETIRWGARAALRAIVHSDWLVTLSNGYQEITAHDAQYVSPGGGRLHRANQLLESSRNTFTETALSVEHGNLWGDLKSTTSYVQHKFSSRSDASDALPLFGLGSPAVGSYDEPIGIQMLSEDLVFTSPNSGRLQWLAGLYGSATWETTDSTVRAGSTAAAVPTSFGQTLYAEHRVDRRDSGAFYGDASYAITDRLTATVGLRLTTSNAQTQSLVQAPITDQQRSYAGRTSSSGYAPKFALSYAVAPDETVYALASQGRRAGGVNTGGPIGTVFVTSGNLPGVHRNFGSDELWNLETGAKLNFFNGRLSLNVAGFYDIWTNIQTDLFMPSGLSYTANAGDGNNLGAELELVARPPVPGLTLQATALINRPELTHPDPGFTAGVGLPGVPDLSFGLRASYRWRIWGDVEGLTFAESQYIGRSHVIFGPISPSEGGYALTRLSAQLLYRQWRMAFFLSNPTNARANTFAYGNPFNFQEAQQVTPERPATIRATLSRQF